MKKILLIFSIFCIISGFCFAQNKKALSHFWDIPWGVSMERAEAIFHERGFETSRNENSLITQTVYEREEALIILLFNRANRFFSASVIYPAHATTVFPKYENYQLVLFRRYGVPDTTLEYFTNPFSKGDGREIEAINSENAFYFTQWNFEDTNQASVTILRNLNICLSFQSPAFSDPASQ